MRFIKRYIKDYKRKRKDKPLLGEFTKALKQEYGNDILIKPIGDRGQAAVYKIIQGDEVIGVGRVANRTRMGKDIKDCMPYRRVGPEARIEYEWACCELGAKHNLTPKPLWKSDHHILVSYCEGADYQEYSLKNRDKIWDYILRGNILLSEWHRLGKSHMDASLTNIVGDLDCKHAYLIDFEYIPAPDLDFAGQKAYDYLRLVESVYKFIPIEQLKQCEIWEKQLETLLDDETRKADIKRLKPAIERVLKDQYLSQSISRLFNNEAQ